MASGRFLSTTISEDERLNSLSIEAQMVYLMTVPHLDRDGLINGNPSVLHGKVCPLRTKLASRMPKIIEEWVESELVIRYANGKGSALWFKGFAKNNPLTHYNREKASLYIAPPGYVRGEKGLVPEAEYQQKEKEISANDTSGNPPYTSGKTPEESGIPPREVEVEVEVEVDHSISEVAESTATPTEPTLSEQVFDRLAEEWATVNPTQAIGHTELAQRYGFAAWEAGLERCSRGKRHNHSYVEKAILSAVDENPSLEKKKPKPAPTRMYVQVDPITGARQEILQ
jgi:predicted transcriptional regulator